MGNPNTTLADGSPVTDDHTDIKPNGQQKDYVVLSEEERAKGFVEPVRLSYIHEKCGGVTKMAQSIAEIYARDPEFYGGMFCSVCGDHFPIGADGEFVWDGTDQKVGTRQITDAEPATKFVDPLAQKLLDVQTLFCGVPICDDDSEQCRDCKKIDEAVAVLNKIGATEMLEALNES